MRHGQIEQGDRGDGGDGDSERRLGSCLQASVSLLDLRGRGSAVTLARRFDLLHRSLRGSGSVGG